VKAVEKHTAHRNIYILTIKQIHYII